MEVELTFFSPEAAFNQDVGHANEHCHGVCHEHKCIELRARQIEGPITHYYGLLIVVRGVGKGLGHFSFIRLLTFSWLFRVNSYQVPPSPELALATTEARRKPSRLRPRRRFRSSRGLRQGRC